MLMGYGNNYMDLTELDFAVYYHTSFEHVVIRPKLTSQPAQRIEYGSVQDLHILKRGGT